MSAHAHAWNVILLFVDNLRVATRVCQLWKKIVNSRAFLRMHHQGLSGRGAVIGLTLEQVCVMQSWMSVEYARCNDGRLSRLKLDIIKPQPQPQPQTIRILKFLASLEVYKRLIQSHLDICINQWSGRSWRQGRSQATIMRRAKDYIHLFILGDDLRFMWNRADNKEHQTELRSFDYCGRQVANIIRNFGHYDRDSFWTRLDEVSFQLTKDYAWIHPEGLADLFTHLFSRQPIYHMMSAACAACATSSGRFLRLPWYMLVGLLQSWRVFDQREVKSSPPTLLDSIMSWIIPKPSPNPISWSLHVTTKREVNWIGKWLCSSGVQLDSLHLDLGPTLSQTDLDYLTQCASKIPNATVGCEVGFLH